MAPKPSLDELQRYPGMVRWFNPDLLMKLLWQVIVSGLFGQYADRRLIEAALDTVPEAELVKRAEIAITATPDSEGAIWIDYVADLGDGFDATYAIAYLLAQNELTVDGHTLPRGAAVVMGGDEVYPTSRREDYKQRTQDPYAFALPDHKAASYRRLLALPGNHDWYDGLVTFLAFFCRAKPTRFGQWRTEQRRSYFAVKLSEVCWLWAIDIALVSDMDQPQADYFVAIAKAMPQGANIILCSAEPGWYKAEQNGDSFRTLSYAAWIAENAGKALRIPLILSGDTHHYSRYSGPKGSQYITSGGGGAFLHGTHGLPEQIRADWLRDLGAVLDLKTEPDGDHKPCAREALWPTRAESRNLLWGNLKFPVLNWDFALLLGGIYWLLAFALSQLPRGDVTALVAAFLAIGFTAYAGYQEGWRTKIIALSLIHAALHVAALFALVWLLHRVDAQLLQLRAGPWWLWLITMAIFFIPVGGAVAAFLFGLNLLVTCMWFNMNHNDAFSAMRVFDYRHFLRIRILGDQITVYSIGLERVPRRSEWQDNPASPADPNAPYFIPHVPMVPRLIERPIVISGWKTPPTGEVKTPRELPKSDAQ